MRYFKINNFMKIAALSAIVMFSANIQSVSASSQRLFGDLPPELLCKISNYAGPHISPFETKNKFFHKLRMDNLQESRNYILQAWDTPLENMTIDESRDALLRYLHGMPLAKFYKDPENVMKTINKAFIAELDTSTKYFMRLHRIYDSCASVSEPIKSSYKSGARCHDPNDIIRAIKQIKETKKSFLIQLMPAWEGICNLKQSSGSWIDCDTELITSISALADNDQAKIALRYFISELKNHAKNTRFTESLIKTPLGRVTYSNWITNAPSEEMKMKIDLMFLGAIRCFDAKVKELERTLVN